ncbi:beta-1,3-galactosyltransferase 5-like [Phlebotomus argentipes]|uniref:beta-1,3-galactosyltransferase 5-like n=1 Tax=Phlebotomus argentipes TaxID=94469 RepID=UPI002892BD5D|nr:beta-1,3-galactosyltransferase 5-like [Phlebotomus argentipes]
MRPLRFARFVRLVRLALLALAALILFNLVSLSSPPVPSSEPLLNITDFRFILSPPSCKALQLNPTVLILVHSAPTNVDKRRTIRETWGAWRRNIRVLFLLGEAMDYDKSLQHEAEIYGDIVQGSFRDTYHNLTYKHTMALRWTREHCPEAHFLFKVDDDIYVNTPALISFLMNAQQTALICLQFVGNPVLRDVSSVWYVSHEDYPNDTYPVHCSGYGIIYPRETIERMEKAVHSLPFFWIDDVFVSGIAREKAQIAVQEIDQRVLPKPQAQEVVEGKRDISTIDSILYSYGVEELVIRRLWHMTQLRQSTFVV